VSAPTPVARSRALGPAFDLLSAFDPSSGFFIERGGTGVASAGCALRVAAAPGERQIARAAESLAEAFASVRAGDSVIPVAVGAFPFEPTREASLAVPRRAVLRLNPGITREVVIDEKSSGSPAAPMEGIDARSTPRSPFEPIQVRPVPVPSEYEKNVAAAVSRIRTGELRKVVLARTVEVDAGRVLDARSLLRRLRAVDPESYAFAVPAGPGDDEGLLVGASPELLVSRRGRRVRANPLAGSAPRAGDPDEDRASSESLAADAKNREEHEIVVEAVAAALDPFCDELSWDREPVLLETANVWHLSTRFQGVLRDPPPTALELVASLHPTPAVCGEPTAVASAAIRDYERFDRGLYAGPIGWVDVNGDGEWAIALRCAALNRDRTTLYSGAGIVGGSEPAAEVDETDRKFRAFLDALRWG
jgi:isochorismate synthase